MHFLIGAGNSRIKKLGGGANNVNNSGVAGGSGIVIVRYAYP